MLVRKGSKPRRGPRVAMSMPSKVRVSARDSMIVEVENLSAYGLRASGKTSVRRGDWISIEVPDLGPISARIAWAKDGCFGVMFRKEVGIDPYLPRRGLFEIVTGLPIGLRNSVWVRRPEGEPASARSKLLRRPLESGEQRRKRIARAQEEMESHLAGMKEERATRLGLAPPARPRRKKVVKPRRKKKSPA